MISSDAFVVPFSFHKTFFRELKRSAEMKTYSNLYSGWFFCNALISKCYCWKRRRPTFKGQTFMHVSTSCLYKLKRAYCKGSENHVLGGNFIKTLTNWFYLLSISNKEIAKHNRRTAGSSKYKSFMFLQATKMCIC